MDKIALVTGAGSGIGRASALQLMKDGYIVVLTGRRREALEETARLGPDGKSHVFPADMMDPKSVEALFAEVHAKFGRLDVLFNNAGTSPAKALLEDVTFEDWQRVVATNFTGPFLCTQHAFKIMKAQTPKGGRIINNGSISAHVPRPNSVAYTSTKHAITGLTRSAALDGRAHDIGVGQIDIGNAGGGVGVLAGMQKNAQTQAGSGTAIVEARMDLDAVARAVSYMASLPLDANVLFMTVMATKMPFVGRG